MPSVGMRRTTRVFGVVKRVDGARVLRSGRRLWPNSGDDVKLRPFVDKDDWYRLMKNNGNGNSHNHKSKTISTRCKSYGLTTHEEVNSKELDNGSQSEEDKSSSKKRKMVKAESADYKGNADRMFGLVYGRKRKRVDKRIAVDYSEHKLCGIQYSRRRRRMTSDKPCRPVLTIVVDGYCSMRGLFEYALYLVLRYMSKTKWGSSQLAQLLPQMITRFYSYHGLRFLLDAPAYTKGVCKFYGARQLTPLFSVDYAAVPLCFMYMHRVLLVRMMFRSFAFVNKQSNMISNGEQVTEPLLMEESETDDEIVVTETSGSSNNDMLHPSVRASKLAGRNWHYRNGLNARSFRKRRSSLRRRRAKNLSVGLQKANLARKNDVPLSSIVLRNKPRASAGEISSKKPMTSPRENSRNNSPQENSSRNLKEMSSLMMEPNQDMDSVCCSVNVLTFESDRCRREVGASVVLELSSSREWLLVVKKDGSIIYTHKAENLMKPCACNRLTHAIMWTGDDTWKLEFCDRLDWSIFKELYKECSNRNASAPNIKVIPVPGVCEVPWYESDDHVPFHMPVSYISVSGDEVSRAMAKCTAMYDMDSEDEAWLKKFNDRQHEHLSEDNFELMIDKFEKALFIGRDDYFEEKAAAPLGHLDRPEVVEAVYSYWTRKRKQKKAPLLRVFQGHALKKAPVVPKPLFRKRRSFKRQASQHFGRGKQASFLQAMAAERYALEEHNATLKADEAKAAASRCVEAAIVKRRRAQVLMENADLAVYKAVMALRIAEAARVTESSEAAASHYLD